MMGSLGLDLKSQVEALIDDPNLKSEAIVNSTTLSEGDYGGYGTGTATVNSTALINAIPSQYIRNKTLQQQFGDLESGELRLLMKNAVVIDAKDDTVTFESEDYRVREIKPIFFNEEVIAKAVTMSKQTE